MLTSLSVDEIFLLRIANINVPVLANREKTFVPQLCANTGYNLEYTQAIGMIRTDGERERERERERRERERERVKEKEGERRAVILT